MGNDRLDRKHATVATSPNARAVPVCIGSERRFLEDQAASAKTAIMQTLQNMKQTGMRVADVRVSARHHPWLVTSSVVAAGFVAGAVLTDSPRQKVRTTRTQAADHAQELPPKETTAWLSTVSTALTAAVVSVLQGALSAAVVSFFAGTEASTETRPCGDAAHQGDFTNGTV